MLTFVHTADWHLGRVYRRLGARAGDSARWRFEAVLNIFALAAREKADFILVAGDVFETDTPRREVMREAVDLLREAPAPVYLLPGHSDPAAEGSVWHHPDFAGALSAVPTIHLALRPEPLPLEEKDALLLPCPILARQAQENVTAWIPDSERGGVVRIGLAHGRWFHSLEEDAAGAHDTLDAGCSERCGLDYLALGSAHVPTQAADEAAKMRAYDSGTPECGAAADVEPGHALLVRIPFAGGEPHVEKHFVGRARTHDWGTIILHPGQGWGELEVRLAAIEDKENALLRAQIGGCLSETEMSRFDLWLGNLHETLLATHIEHAELGSAPTDEEWAALRLEMSEERILQVLGASLDAAELEAVKDAELIAAWSESEAARREARALFYQLLRS